MPYDPNTIAWLTQLASDPGWTSRFTAEHNGRAPSSHDAFDAMYSLSHGPASWAPSDWINSLQARTTAFGDSPASAAPIRSAPPIIPPARWWEGNAAAQGIAPEDSAWNAEHAHGYGTVDAPSPFGYNRDVFEATHAPGSYSYYDPSTGRYDAPNEIPFSVAGPSGPSMIGTGGGTQFGSYAPLSPESSASMPGAGGGSGSWGDVGTIAPPQMEASMPGANGTTTEPTPNAAGFDLGAFLDAISSFGDQSGGGDKPEGPA